MMVDQMDDGAPVYHGVDIHPDIIIHHCTVATLVAVIYINIIILDGMECYICIVHGKNIPKKNGKFNAIRYLNYPVCKLSGI